MVGAVILLVLLAATLFVYAVAIRPWHLQWGASHLDRVAQIPGDEISPRAPGNITRAININAPPEAIWPHLENLVREHAKSVGLVCVIARAPNAMVLVSESDAPRVQAGDEAVDATSAFFVKPLPDGRTRVLARIREASFEGVFARFANFFVNEPRQFLATRKILETVKARAEGSPGVQAPVKAASN